MRVLAQLERLGIGNPHVAGRIGAESLRLVEAGEFPGRFERRILVNVHGERAKVGDVEQCPFDTLAALAAQDDIVGALRAFAQDDTVGALRVLADGICVTLSLSKGEGRCRMPRAACRRQ